MVRPSTIRINGGTTMSTNLAEFTKTLNKSCSVEVYRRNIPGNIDIWYHVAQSRPGAGAPNPDPVDIISWDQAYYVIVYVHLADGVRRHLCGELCVDIDVDTCGPAPDVQFDEQHVTLDPCGDGWYTIVFPLPAGTFAPQPGYPNRCGRVYRLCVTVGSRDACGNPGLIWGHCSSVDVAVHPPVTTP
jgi:hypothetical protein